MQQTQTYQLMAVQRARVVDISGTEGAHHTRFVGRYVTSKGLQKHTKLRLNHPRLPAVAPGGTSGFP